MRSCTCTSLFMLQFIRRKGLIQTVWCHFKKQQIKHHLFNIIISCKNVFSQFYSLTTSRTGVIIRFWKHLCDHERSSIHQHSGFALGSYQSLYIFFYSFIMLCFNIHSANLEISRYASKKCSWQFGNMTRARVLFLFRFCVRIQIRVVLGESLIH